jgi:hypothetical protein
MHFGLQFYIIMDMSNGNTSGTIQSDTQCEYTVAVQCTDTDRTHFHWDMGGRSLSNGEQYYWYQ